jgi:hypothetical protein
MMLFAILLATLSVVTAAQSSQQQPLRNGQTPHFLKVPITLGVMSRCPDALACEAVFTNVLKRVDHDKVDIDLTFVAR